MEEKSLSMEEIKIIMATVLKVVSVGLIIFSKELFKSSKPTKIISAETNVADIYSILPCPKGCSLSAGFIDNL